MVINGKRVKFVSLVLLVGNLEGNLRHPTNPKERVSWLKISLSHFASTKQIFLNYQKKWLGFADDRGDWKWSFGIVSPHLFLFSPITRKRDTLHRYWDLSLFLLTEKMKTARLTRKGALKSKSVDQGSFWMKTVKQKSHNTWKEVKAFKDFQRFYSNGNAIILGPLSHHPDNVLHLK